MKKSSSEVVLDSQPHPRNPSLQRKPSLKSTNLPLQPEKQSNSLSISKIKAPKLKYFTNQNIKIDRKRIVIYGLSNAVSQTFTIQNIGKDVLKISLSFPKTQIFQLCQQAKSFTLSSGMSRKISIGICRSSIFTEDSYLDEIVIQTQHSRDCIKLEWFLQKPCLKYAPLIDLKTIDLGKQQKISVDFTNDSKEHRISKVRLIKDTWDNIQISPDQFTLPPLKTIKVQIIVFPQALGAYHHKIVVELEQKIVPSVEIVYSAIDFAFRIQNDKHEPVKQLNFGPLLKGASKEIAVYAHNNSPVQVEVKSKIKIGKSLRAESTLQSPQQLGVECSSTVIEVVHKALRIPPFSRKRFVLTTQSQLEERQRLLVDRFARTQALSSMLKSKIVQQESDHHEILVCQFLQLNKKSLEVQSLFSKNVIVIPMHAKFTLPSLKITPNSLCLGKVSVGGTVQAALTIQNTSTEVPCHLSVSKLFSFDFFFIKQDLAPKELTTMELYLKGTNIGAYHAHIELLISGLYPIKIPVQYEVVNASNERPQEKLYKTGFSSLHNSSEDTVDFSKTLFNAKAEKNRSKYEKVNFRKSMSKVKSSHSLFQRELKTEVLESLRNSGTKGKQNGTKEKFAGDDDISCSLHETRLSASQGKKYNLFVTKKIDKYVPFQELKEHKKLQKTRNSKDYFSSTIKRAPKNRKQAEEIERQLTPEQLKQITINEKIISFGRVFIKSKAEKEFIIGNNTEAAIIVQLHQNTTDQKKLSILSECDYAPQVVGQNGAARFKIVFNAQTCGKFQSTLSYTINGIHTFQLLIQADIELVSLAISKTSLRMAYLDDVSEILLKDNFMLRNEGNTAATFSVVQANSRYIVQPAEGVIQKGESLTVWVMENNENYPVIQAGEAYQGKASSKAATSLGDDRILIKIIDGNDISLKVTTVPGLSDPRCIVKEVKLLFGCTIVSKPKTKTFQLKNLSRTLCLFEIFNEQCDQFLAFDCIKGRIPPQGSKEITVTYKSTLIHCLISNFQILIRGGLIINVPIQAESIAPEVSIIQSEFAFGEVCCDTAAVKPISVKNESETLVELYVDLRSRERGVDFLMISLWNSTNIGIGQKSKAITNYRAATFEEEIIDNPIKQAGVHRIKVDAKSILTFSLVYKPTAAGYYEFVLPIFLQNFIRNESLTKIVSCNAIEPKFIIEPSIIKFKKKIINDKENSCFHPFMQYLTLRNPTDKVLKWKLDVLGQHKTGTSFSSYSSVPLFGNKKETMSPKLCFEIQEKRGELKPKESVSINVSFNPLQQGFYCHKIPLFIFNQEKGTYHQQAEIRLQGEGKYPSLYFNKKQLIMPVVPIGIQSISMFQVYNEGYESINLKHRFEIMDSEGNIHISKGNLIGDSNFPEIIAVFPEGGKMGNNKRQLFVIVKFISKRSISFTCKLELYDEATDCRTYSLSVSGTADNSILTTFSYLSDPENIFRFEQCAPETNEAKKTQKPKLEDSAVSAMSIVLKTNDGRNLIDRYHSTYDEMTTDSFNLDCRIIKRWLNSFFREEKVRDFPLDLSQNGEILLKLLHRLTSKKQFEGSWQFEVEGAGKEILNGHNNSLVFYEQVLRVLKTMGCLLNHIRPYYLLEREDFAQHMSKDPNWRIYSDYYMKKHEVMYREAWLVLVYQIIQHFWCARIRSDTSYSTSKVASNVYSPVELQVLRWVKGIYEEFNELEDAKDKFLSFGSDFKDCIAPIFCLVKYSIPPRRVKSLESLNRKPISANEYAVNTKILYQMLEKLNIVPLIYEDEYQLCREKEIFMFMYQLYELLPQTYPKLPPVIFACELGESCSRVIDIRNPSAKTVHYWVKLEGCKDFSFEEKESIVVEPKAVYPFRVDYKSRLSTEQVAFVSLFSKQEAEVNSINGSALVFELRSKITGRKSIRKLDSIACPLYETVSVKVLVQNVFEDHELGNFAIQLREEPLEQSIAPQKQKVETSEHSNPLSTAEKQGAKVSQFYSELEVLKIKRGNATSFDLYFMPVKLAKTRCFIVFSDPSVGEFQYEIIGSPEIPKPLQEIKCQSSIFVGHKDWLELSLPVYNSYMLKCESYFEQKCLLESARRNAQRERADEKYRLELNMDAKIADYVTFPAEVTLKHFKKDIVSGIDSQNKIRLEYNFTHLLKDLTLDFLLIGDPRREIQDVRRFKVGLTIVHRSLQQELVMTTTARKSLAQLIPLENSSAKDWKVKASILENENGWLSLKEGEKVSAKELVVKRGQAQSIALCFEPKWVGRSVGRVSVHNQTTNEQLLFLVRGVAEEPLSENHFHLKVNALDSTLFTVPIANPYHERLNYRVLSDIEELQLPPDITLEPSEQLQFNFIAESIASSPQIGFIKFVDAEGRYFWYSITLECSERKVREFWVEMSAEVGKEVEKLVEFKNPFNRPLSFRVELPKEGFLEAKEEFVVGPHSTHEYKIKFRPFRAMNCEVAIRAANKEIGSFVYHTKLTAREETRRRLYTLSVEVGKVGSLDLKLDNNSKNSAKVNCHLTNHACYEVDLPQLLLPNADNICRVKFKPSAQGKQPCTVKVWGEHFPTRLFEIEGTGIAPYSIEVINFKALPNQTCLEIIKFHNPNPKRTAEPVRVCLEGERSCFRIVSHSRPEGQEAEVKDLLVIPVQFTPKEKGYFESVLTLQCFNYQWKYLLKGSTSFKEVERVNEELVSLNKQETIRLLKIPIPEYIEQGVGYFNRVEVEHSDKRVARCVRAWMKLRLNNALKAEEGEDRVVTVYLKFRPRKQLKEVVRLVLSNGGEEGPKISYNMQVHVKDCGPENTIALEISAIKVINFDIGLAGLGLKEAGVARAAMGKGAYCEVERLSEHIRLKFKPNHLIFNRSRVYTDNLLLESEDEEWNFEVQFTLKK